MTASLDKYFIEAANFMLEKSGSERKIARLKDFDGNDVVFIFERILGHSLQGILRPGKTRKDQQWNIQLVIDEMATEILLTDLSHITGHDVAVKKETSVRNLIEILAGLMEFVLESGDENEESSSGNDSNVLSSIAQSVISEILQEELEGRSTRDLLLTEFCVTTPTSSSSEEQREFPKRRLRRRSRSQGAISPKKAEKELPRTPSVSSIASLSSGVDEKAGRRFGGVRVTKPLSSTPVKKSRDRRREEKHEVRPVDFSEGSTQELLREALKDVTYGGVDESTSSLIAIENSRDVRSDHVNGSCVKKADGQVQASVCDAVEENESQANRPKTNLHDKNDDYKRSGTPRLIQTNQPLLVTSSDEQPLSARDEVKQLEIAAHQSEAAQEVGDVQDARKKLSLEEALQKDRQAILHAVYEQCQKDVENAEKEKKKKSKKKVMVRTPASSLKCHGRSPMFGRRKVPGGPYFGGQAKPRPPWKPTGISMLTQKRVCVGGGDLLPLLVEEFPYLHVSPATLQQLWKKQMHQIHVIAKSEIDRRKRPKAQTELEEAENKQRALVEVMKNDLEVNKRMREKREREFQKRYVKSQLREKQQAVVRAKQYYEKYVGRMKMRQMKRKTREEQIFKTLFEDGLEIQKARLQDLREYAKEKRREQAQRQKSEIESLENYYRDQFGMLAENMAEERKEVQVREEAQAKAVEKMRRELRKRMEKEIEDLQEAIVTEEDDAYFRQLDADRLKDRLLIARFNTKI
eukprot:m.20094 g.20094  ORF g.20094 m.20094 type:complete len:748 (+) comp27972_c0_seq3:54-2297(+)